MDRSRDRLFSQPNVCCVLRKWLNYQAQGAAIVPQLKAIVLLDRIQIELDRSGKASVEAIVAAAQQRFRPILLTTCTTTLGLIPLYLGGGLMWEPMAVAIMVGLLFATVITLMFVPVSYKLLFAVKN